MINRLLALGFDRSEMDEVVSTRPVPCQASPFKARKLNVERDRTACCESPGRYSPRKLHTAAGRGHSLVAQADPSAGNRTPHSLLTTDRLETRIVEEALIQIDEGMFI